MKQFFSTELAPCPYLDGRSERRLVTILNRQASIEEQDRLIQGGFRRSQTFAYRPACQGCTACVPIRIKVEAFRFNRSWRRILKQNGDLAIEEKPPHASEEQFALFQRYLKGRHADGGMAKMSWNDYRSMIEDSPKSCLVIEWRRADGHLIGVCLTDRGTSGLSGVYKFFEPEEPKRSLGTLIILWHVQKALEIGLPYVYLGYWIEGSAKMAYKSRFQPLERLTTQGWRPFDRMA